MKNKFLFIDVETANSSNSSICQIAAINDEIVLNELVDPCAKFDHFNKNFHGIDEKAVFGKPNFKEAFLDKIKLNDYILIGHNINFDVNVIAKDAFRYGVNIEKFNTICTMKLYKSVFPNLEKHKLDFLCNHFNIELNKHHDAYNDALACKKLFENLINGNHLREPIDSYIKEIYPIRKTYPNSISREIKYNIFFNIYNLRVAI
ncbi:MAG: exonuclease domain-containing protein [Clostridia bacterium]